MSFELVAAAGRTIDFDIQLFETDGTTEVTVASTDVVRVKIGRRGTVTLDLDSAAASSNGSTVTISAGTNDVTLRLDQDDSSSLSGPYDVEVNLVDDSDSDKIKHFEFGTLSILGSQDGGTGLS